MIDTEKRKMGFHASEHGFHGLVYFLCPFLGGDAVARKKWQQKVKKDFKDIIMGKDAIPIMDIV